MSEKLHINILPGVGLGDIRFGMTRETIRGLLGEPNHQMIADFSENESHLNDAWEFHPLRMDLSFEEAEDWRLTIISVSSEDYLLHGSSLIGLELEELMDELELHGITDLEIEDVSDLDHTDQKLVSSAALEMNFWINEHICEEIQWGPFFKDENTIRWPEE